MECKHGNADEATRDYIWEAMMEDSDVSWSAYQFEYDEDSDPVFAAYVTRTPDGFRGELDHAWWAPHGAAVFATFDEACEWCASWAWCPDAGQGMRESVGWACPDEECSGVYGERPSILEGDYERGYTCPKCGCHTMYPEEEGCWRV